MAKPEHFIEPRAVAWLVAGLAFTALAVAWLSELGGLAPCLLCYWQRYAYMAVIALAVGAIYHTYQPRRRAIWLGLMTLALLAGTGIAIFHVGVEEKWWAGSAGCTGPDLSGLSGAELEAAINAAPSVRCDEPQWDMFGITMAGYNVGYSLFLAAFAFWGLRQALKEAAK